MLTVGLPGEQRVHGGCQRHQQEKIWQRFRLEGRHAGDDDGQHQSYQHRSAPVAEEAPLRQPALYQDSLAHDRPAGQEDQVPLSPAVPGGRP